MKNNHFTVGLMAAFLLLSSCGTSKNLQNTRTQQVTKPAANTTTKSLQSLTFVQKVSDNRLYTKNVCSNISFNVKTQGKDLTVSGALRMRKDQVIRLQLFIPILGTEAARLEFTPTSVLAIDRLHKQYVKADYSQLDFLKENGLNFYTLQSLFWNQLLIPGQQTLSESDLKLFKVDFPTDSANNEVSYSQNGLLFTWLADRLSGQINQAVVNYSSKAHGKSTLTWNYKNFTSVGAKMFPAYQQFSFNTTATGKKQQVTVTLNLKDINTDSKWDATTQVSDKYKRIEASDVLSELLNF